jgi:hypothetical protein
VPRRLHWLLWLLAELEAGKPQDAGERVVTLDG